jgi:hypothetical protein
MAHASVSEPKKVGNADIRGPGGMHNFEGFSESVVNDIPEG